MPKLSVVVPVYNTEKYLQECIDSVLAQTFDDFELILVDDGSTDKSGAICDNYCQLDGRIRVIHQNNGGVTAARKHGMEVAEGEYISFIDSDDWIEPNMYQDMLTYANLHNADMVLCDMLAEKRDGCAIIRSGNFSGLFNTEQLRQQVYTHMLFDFSENAPGLSLNLCNKMIKSDLAKPVFKEFPSELTYGEDALGSLMCLLRSKSIFIMENSAFYHYRQTEEFLSREQSVSLLPRLSSFALSTQNQFSEYGFDGIDQLSGYIAQVSLYCARQILIFNKEYTMRKKLQLVTDYFKETHIQAMLNKAERLVMDKTLLRKIRLVNKKHITLLFLFFYGKEMILRVKRRLAYK